MKIQLLENIPSCCTQNDAISHSQKITNILVIVKMYKTKNLDHNNGLDDDLKNACVPLASEGGHYNDFKCVKIQLLENIPSCCTLNDAISRKIMD